MALNRFVDVHAVQRGNIETGQPHIDDNSDLEVRFQVLELAVQLLAIVLAAQQIVQLLLVILATSHDHLDPLHRLDGLLLLRGQVHPGFTRKNLIPF